MLLVEQSISLGKFGVLTFLYSVSGSYSGRH
jgi:hypothetical protein